LLIGAVKYARSANYAEYVRMAAAANRKPWLRAMFLDLLLSDVFIREAEWTRPRFATLFLNAGAHIQHHYMFNSPAYDGSLRNPQWYVMPDADPVLDVYRLYDRIVGQLQDVFPETRLMIATGLHQDPHPQVTFYWRLKDHAAYLRKIGVPFKRVEPRMSRDFVVYCTGEEEARRAAAVLQSARADCGTPLFEVENRGSDLFVMLTWPHEIPSDFSYLVGNRRHQGLREEVAFVAIKNGQHNGVGYFLDTGATWGDLPPRFPLAEVPRRVCDAFGLEWSPAR